MVASRAAVSRAPGSGVALLDPACLGMGAVASRLYARQDS
jgi:hypothetical protein